jgi:hypothetical protein
MNGYDEKSHLNEDDFGAKGNIVSAFDAFRMSSVPKRHNHTYCGREKLTNA